MNTADLWIAILASRAPDGLKFYNYMPDGALPGTTYGCTVVIDGYDRQATIDALNRAYQIILETLGPRYNKCYWTKIEYDEQIHGFQVIVYTVVWLEQFRAL